MKEYEVEIIETLSRLVSVKAKDRMQAIEKVKQAYYKNESIVLDSSDYIETNFECYENPSQ